MTDTNPYRAPSADVADVTTPGESELAGRGHRFGAAMVDAIVASAIVLPIGYALGLIDFAARHKQSLGTSLIMELIGFVVFAVLQTYFLMKNGQTIGKKVVGIRIVDLEGKLPTLGKLLGLRYGLLYVVNAVPVVGGVFSLVDVLFIFRGDRRCIHDLIAGTKVVLHKPRYSSMTWFVLPFVFMFVIGIGAAILIPTLMRSGSSTVGGPISQTAPAKDGGDTNSGAQGAAPQDTGSQAAGSQDAGSQDAGSQDTGVQDSGTASPAPVATPAPLGTAAPQDPQRAAADLRKCADLKDPAAIIRCSQGGK